MANPSISIDDEVQAKFDAIREAKEEEFGEGVTISRSGVVEDLMEDWIDENEDYLPDDFDPQDFWSPADPVLAD